MSSRPDCLLVINFTDQIPTDLRQCRACGAFFQWDPATGFITHFYKEGEKEPANRTDDADLEVEGEAAEENRSPYEVIWGTRRKMHDLAERDTIWRRRLLRRTFLIAASLVAIVLWFLAGASWSFPDWVATLCFVGVGVPILAALAGVIAALQAMLIDDAYREFSHRLAYRHEGTDDEPDLDEIAHRIKMKNVIRRPLPSSEPALPDNTSITIGQQQSPVSDVTPANQSLAYAAKPPVTAKSQGSV